MKNEDDGGGNVNSVLLVMPADYAAPARVDDGTIAASALEHFQTSPSLNYDRGQLSLSFRVRPGDVRSIAAIVDDKRFPLEKVSEDELYSRYRTRVPWNRKSDLTYIFELVDGTKTFRYGADGLTANAVGTRPFTVKASEYKPFTVPGWNDFCRFRGRRPPQDRDGLHDDRIRGRRFRPTILRSGFIHAR